MQEFWENNPLVTSLVSHCHQSPYSLVASTAESHQAQSLMHGQLQSPPGCLGSHRGTACASPPEALPGLTGPVLSSLPTGIQPTR